MKTRDWLAFIILGAVWGSSFLWIKIAVQEISPLLLVSLRVFFALLFLAAAALIARPNFPPKGKVWLALFLIGLTSIAIPYVLISWGEKYIDSAMAAILNATTPLFTMIAAQLFLKDDKITPLRFAGLVTGFIGIFILVSGELFSEQSGTLQIADTSSDSLLSTAYSEYFVLLGQLAILLASLFYGFSLVFARRTTQGLSPIVQGLVPILAADAMLWMATYAVEAPIAMPGSSITWIALLWLGLLGTGLAFLLYYYLLHSVGPTRTSMVTYVFPLVGLALGVIVLGENLDWNLLVGSALIVGSIVVVNSRT